MLITHEPILHTKIAQAPPPVYIPLTLNPYTPQPHTHEPTFHTHRYFKSILPVHSTPPYPPPPLSLEETLLHIIQITFCENFII